MKLSLIILIIILNQALLIGQETNKEINDSDRKIWNNLTENEKWESYKTAHNSYVQLKDLYNKQSDRQKLLIFDLEESNKLLKKKYYNHSLGVLLLTGIDFDLLTREIGIDCYAGLFYKRYFYYNRGYFQLGANVKFYQNYGGALLLGLGFNF